MNALSRALARRDLLRIAGAAVGVSWIALLGAFAFAATSVQPSAASLAAAAGALVIAGAAILYAWREPAR